MARQSCRPPGRPDDSSLFPSLHFLVRLVGGGDPVPGLRHPHRLVSHESRFGQRCHREDYDGRKVSKLWLRPLHYRATPLTGSTSPSAAAPPPLRRRPALSSHQPLPVDHLPVDGGRATDAEIAPPRKRMTPAEFKKFFAGGLLARGGHVGLCVIGVAVQRLCNGCAALPATASCSYPVLQFAAPWNQTAPHSHPRQIPGGRSGSHPGSRSAASWTRRCALAGGL